MSFFKISSILNDAIKYHYLEKPDTKNMTDGQIPDVLLWFYEIELKF